MFNTSLTVIAVISCSQKASLCNITHSSIFSMTKSCYSNLNYFVSFKAWIFFTLWVYMSLQRPQKNSYPVWFFFNMALSVLYFKKACESTLDTDKIYGTSQIAHIAIAPRGKIITYTWYLNAETDLQHAIKVTSVHNRPVSLVTSL